MVGLGVLLVGMVDGLDFLSAAIMTAAQPGSAHPYVREAYPASMEDCYADVVKVTQVSRGLDVDLHERLSLPGQEGG